jgi:predicted lipoprotein with Yx(FWY)xxD motif
LRADGSTQWAYKKRPLYTHSNDKLPGDAYGVGLDEHWSVAVITENFRPANVSVTALEGYGDALALNGMTLYGGYAFEKRWGGRNLRDTFTNVYAKGKQLGGAACADAQCLSKWRPFAAPANAQPSGFWEPISRRDGTKQWAYKGYALYSYAGDDAPGQHNGQATYDFEKFEGEGFDLQRVAYLKQISNASGGVGIYWNIAKP